MNYEDLLPKHEVTKLANQRDLMVKTKVYCLECLPVATVLLMTERHSKLIGQRRTVLSRHNILHGIHAAFKATHLSRQIS